VALAFSMFGYYEIQLPSGLQSKITNISNKQEGGNLIGVAIMGFLSALIVGQRHIRRDNPIKQINCHCQH
jgi:thiol:disulfide interchange protein DsbD